MKDSSSYFEVDPWNIIQTHFDDKLSLFSESIFSLSNERMGTRGTFEEGYSGQTMEGNYFAGLYESLPIDNVWEIPGFPTHKDFIVNAMRWVGLSILLDGEQFDMAKALDPNDPTPNSRPFRRW